MNVCLANLAKATAQQVMDQCVQGLLRQGEKSRAKRDQILVCCYRGDEGRKCGAGFLISDEEYKNIGSTIEGNGWTSLVYDEIAPGEHERLISRIQSIHDTTEPFEWQAELRDLCRRHELAYNPPKDIHHNCANEIGA